MKYPKSDEGDESEAWLVSYADMMTLIACFFILMMAFANFDPIGFFGSGAGFNSYAGTFCHQ